jgi:hypothetical protein
VNFVKHFKVGGASYKNLEDLSYTVPLHLVTHFREHALT